MNIQTYTHTRVPTMVLNKYYTYNILGVYLTDQQSAIEWIDCSFTISGPDCNQKPGLAEVSVIKGKNLEGKVDIRHNTCPKAVGFGRDRSLRPGLKVT